jgi:Holliday junction resolvase
VSRASKGRAYEHEVRALLESDGYSVTRGAGSKGEFDSPNGIVKADLIATKMNRVTKTLQIILVQAKVRA